MRFALIIWYAYLCVIESEFKKNKIKSNLILMKRIAILIVIACCIITKVQAQCLAGEVEVTISIDVDQYGYETYWELLPAGNACGVGTIASGGNVSVGCNGGGVQAQTLGGYANSSTNNAGPWCLLDGMDYDIFFVDDWGDGGATFTVKVSGFPVYTFSGTGTDETFTFTASAPPAIDASVTTIEVYEFMEAGSIAITGDIKNVGSTAITSFDLNYSIDNGAIVTENIGALNLSPFTTYMYNHNTLWNVTTAGTYTVKVWVDNVNGAGNDADITNDMMSKDVTVIEPTPNIIPSYTTDTITLTHTVVGTSTDLINKPQDLDFHPNGDLWVANRGLGGNVNGGGGTTVKFTDPDGLNQSSDYKKDQNSKHFMNCPTGIAFSLNGNFSTSPGMFDANFSGGNPFTGPALWSSDPLIYAQPSGGNGSHLDMLHASSYAMGIAHETGNVFWIYDGNNNDIVRYDFSADHGAGNTYHDDGKIRRFTGMVVNRIDDVIGSHMELDKKTGWMYIVDNGNKRVLRLDINSGSIGGTPSYGPFETLAEYKNIDGATWETVVDSGLIEPSGIDVIDNRMIVTDHSTGDIIIYDVSSMPAIEIKRIVTGNPGIMGTVIGPQGRIWYVNYLMNELVKIEPSQIITPPPTVSIIENKNNKEFTVFPNPSTGKVVINLTNLFSNTVIVRIQDIVGKTVLRTLVDAELVNLDLFGLSEGIYMINVEGDNYRATKKLIIQK